MLVGTNKSCEKPLRIKIHSRPHVSAKLKLFRLYTTVYQDGILLYT